MANQINTSQTVIEVSNDGAAAARSSQVVAETLETGSLLQVNTSQVVAESLETGAGLNVRATQVVLEVLCWGSTPTGYVSLLGMGNIGQ